MEGLFWGPGTKYVYLSEMAGHQREGRLSSSNPKIGTGQKAEILQQQLLMMTMFYILEWILETWDGDVDWINQAEGGYSAGLL
jgi:hypothetical protein